MADQPLTTSYLGTMLTVILGEITKSTSSSLVALTTIIAATFTAIFTGMKMYDWVYHKRKQYLYNKKHKQNGRPKS